MHRITSAIIWFLIRLLFSMLFYGAPMIGFWLVSSLAAYLGGPPWMAWAAGAFLFPIIPGLWELHAWTHRRAESKPLLKPLERLSLRTFVVGIVFLAALLYIYPQTAFVALSTRGDWMLDGIKDARADRIRQAMFAVAGGVEWLYHANKSNPYKALIDPKALELAEEATKEREQQELAEKPKSDQLESLLYHPLPLDNQDETETSKQTDGDATATESDQQQPEELVDKAKIDKRESLLFHPRPIAHNDGDTTDQIKTDQNYEQNNADKVWPWKQPTLHSAVATMPASVETSIKSVARYIADHEKDPVLRIKALHDYVADRIAYDSVSLYSGNFPPQDAQTTFKTRKSVCAGYANLLSALAKAINEKIVVVSGNARDLSTGDLLSGSGHAWNAANIKGKWYLIDVCWDAGYVSREKGFTKEYRTDYLLLPPSVMIEDHFPEESTWQLLARPLSQGEFLRQPMLRPTFQSHKLTLLSPTRARNETESKAVAIVQNPKKQWLMAALEEDGKQIGPSSAPNNTETTRLEFPLPGKGTYRLNMYANEGSKYSDEYNFVGSVDFVSR